jgi:predicted outer membrane lipoprotein
MLLSSPVVILQFLVVAAAFTVIGALWLTLTNPLYRSHTGELPADRPNLGYAVAFHLGRRTDRAFHARGVLLFQ